MKEESRIINTLLKYSITHPNNFVYQQPDLCKNIEMRGSL